MHEDAYEEKKRNNSFFFGGIKILYSLLGEEKKNLNKIIILTLLVEILFMFIPFSIKLVTDTLPGVIENGMNNYFYLVLLAMFIVPILGLALRELVLKKFSIRSIINLENYWPVIMQDKMLALHQGYHSKENTAKKAAKIQKGCDKMLGIFINLMESALPNFFYLVVNFVIIFSLSPVLALIFFGPFIPMAFKIKKIYDERVPKWDLWAEKYETSNAWMTQSIINIFSVQGYVQENRERGNLLSLRKEMKDLDLDIHLSMNREMFVVNLVLQSALFSAVMLGIYFVFQKQMELGTLLFLIATGGASMYSLENLIRTYSYSMKDMVQVYRAADLLKAREEVLNQGNIIPEKYHGKFCFKSAVFTYTGKKEPVISNLNLEICPGKMHAIVGPSGGGKSTISKLLSRAYDLSFGSLTLDGEHIVDIDRDWYRKLFAVVQQDVDVFDTSLLENITYGFPEATSDQIDQSLRASFLDELLKNENKFPDGLDTVVGERGVALSGGEKQRVGIARAYLSILGGAKVLILDEATSSLDSQAEKAIQKMVEEAREHLDVSIVAIAHRLSTVYKADLIYVVEDGRVAEKGGHKKLLKKKGLYAKLVSLQELGDVDTTEN